MKLLAIGLLLQPAMWIQETDWGMIADSSCQKGTGRVSILLALIWCWWAHNVQTWCHSPTHTQPVRWCRRCRHELVLISIFTSGNVWDLIETESWWWLWDVLQFNSPRTYDTCIMQVCIGASPLLWYLGIVLLVNVGSAWCTFHYAPDNCPDCTDSVTLIWW